jgi:histidyl-tRNA synthetase
MEKPSLPKGTRDFGPATMAKRQFILNIIRTVFQKYGFQPLETPAMENLETLTGKYGEEGDQLLFKILESGDYYQKMLSRILSPQRITRITNFLFDSLKFLCEKLNQELTDKEIYENDVKVADIVKNNLHLSFINYSLYLEFDEEEVLTEFYSKYYSYLSSRLAQLFRMANIHKENYDENFAFHFDQFRNTDIQNDILPLVENFILKKLTSWQATQEISGKGLRYDLTVPFARFVVMNRGEVTLPFKRYQIQPVWRADRPQRGRYREFYQCDADVVGTDSLVNEAEIVLMIQNVFSGLGISDFTIKINHRGILSGLAELCGAQENENALFVAIDKLDKIGEEKVKEELLSKGFSEVNIKQVFEILNFQGSNQQKSDLLIQKFQSSEKGKKGIEDLNNVVEILKGFNTGNQKPETGNQKPETGNNLQFDLSLARGLSYYTGCIFEVKVNNVAIGSVSGGGRYDNLTQAFGSKEKLSGVGISFGIDRIYDVMEELKIFPKEAGKSSTVLVAHFDQASMMYGLHICQALRNNGIATEIYPDVSKLKKQLEYADKKMIPFALVIGPDEMQTGMLSLKNLETGTQEKLTLEAILSQLKK